MFPGFRVPTRDELSKEQLPMLFAESKAQLKDWVRDARRVAITIDAWTSIVTRGYLGMI
jgi:hypothetical protein